MQTQECTNDIIELLSPPIKIAKLHHQATTTDQQQQQQTTPHCHYYVKSKSRYCRNQLASSSTTFSSTTSNSNGDDKGNLFLLYCPVHASEMQKDDNDDAVSVSVGDKEKKKSTKNKERIPCPVDPSHTIYARNLKKHVKSCNKTIQDQTRMSMPFYVENVNLFDKNQANENTSNNHGRSNVAVVANVNSVGDEEKENKDKELRLQESMLRQWLKSIDQESFVQLVAKIKDLYWKLRLDSQIPFDYKEPELCKLLANQNAQSKVKHMKQQCSIIGHMMHQNCLSEDMDYFEFGCGKAELSYMIRKAILLRRKQEKDAAEASAVATTHPVQEYVLIDRSNQRRKCDNNIRYTEQRGTTENRNASPDSSVKVNRILIDIAHLYFDKINTEHNNRPCVGISKHLCGIATDLTLRCVTQTNDSDSKRDVSGLFIALCCHHKCSWNSYINQKFFEQHGFTGREFEQIKLLTSWAICQFKNQEANVTESDTLNNFSIQDRIELGFMCKRIIDYGRILYLQQQNFDANLVYYCDRDITPENCLLVCTSKKN